MFRTIVALSVLCFVAVNGEESYDDRIVNGRTASIHEFPYQVSIQKRGSHFCGGSIISPNWVVTAAHCMVGTSAGEISCRAGSTTWGSGGVLNQAIALFIHSKYDPKSMVFDVALIKLLKAFVWSAVIKPVKICSRTPSSGTHCQVAGWGTMREGAPTIPSQLQMVDLKFLTKEECASPAFRYGPAILDSMFCATGGDKDSCQGDSGGPIVDTNNNCQCGVVSWGHGCAQAGRPGVYVNLHHKEVKLFIISNVPGIKM